MAPSLSTSASYMTCTGQLAPSAQRANVVPQSHCLRRTQDHVGCQCPTSRAEECARRCQTSFSSWRTRNIVRATNRAAYRSGARRYCSVTKLLAIKSSNKPKLGSHSSQVFVCAVEVTAIQRYTCIPAEHGGRLSTCCCSADGRTISSATNRASARRRRGFLRATQFCASP